MDEVDLVGAVKPEAFCQGIQGNTSRFQTQHHSETASSAEFVGDSEALARRSAKESPELSAGGIERSLLIFATVIKERGAALDHLEEDLHH